MDSVKNLGVKYDGDGMDLFIDSDKKYKSSLPSSFIAFVIGAKFNTKRYPAAKVIRLIERLDEDIVLIGGPEDLSLGKEIANSSSNTINLCGKLNLIESADVIGRSRKVITNDTGMMHIAAALDKDIVSIWGNTIPEFGMYPFYRQNSSAKSAIIENQGLGCRPCSKIGFANCPKKHFKCMNDLDLDLIRKAVNEK